MDIISPWMMYFWTRLDEIHVLFFNITFFAFIFAFGCALFAYSNCFGTWSWVYEYECIGNREKTAQEIRETISSYKNTAKKLAIIGFISMFLMPAVPSKEDVAIMYVIPKIANNKNIQQEASEMYEIAKDALKNYTLPKK